MMTDPETAAPLDGVTVLDFTRVLSGPYCTMLMADMGARVIKIEQPGRGDDTRAWGPPFAGTESAYFMSVNRNKQSLTLDLKSAAARPLLDRLIARADVLVENFRPGAMARLGLDYPTLSASHRGLIYCSISGFGQTGPRRDEPGYDAVMQGEGGLMSITGDADGAPYRLGVAISDIATGMFAFQGIAMALLARGRTGRGQFVDVGMLDATASLLTYQAGNYLTTGEVPGRLGNRHPTIVPYETFAATDGDFVLAVGNDSLWRAFCQASGLEELGADPRFATNPQRVRAYDEIKGAIVPRLRTRTRAEWIATFTAAGVPCGAVRNVGEVLEDPQIEARDMVKEVAHHTLGVTRVLGVPVKLSATPGSVRTAPPTLGQHTDAILRDDLGLEQQAIEALRGARAI
jgi:crotonobetainyl-CoA:carnitine CoA-transferase CaiB-like acyl-CoA transferase